MIVTERPKQIEAFQFTLLDSESIVKWCNGTLKDKGIEIETPGYVLWVNTGMWIIRDGEGNYTSETPDSFKAKYQSA